MKRMRIALALLILLGSFSVSASELDDAEALVQPGLPTAHFNLGSSYYSGKGTPQNYKEALKWFKASAEKGNSNAQRALAVMYYRGEGITQDYREAAKWFVVSAEQGNEGAQYYLGVIHYEGEGTPQDYKTAHMWWNLAAANGHEGAKTNRDKVAETMTPADISEAQQMAADWVKAHP
ncbi:MAG TPA: hypothetical protein DCY55_06180 [Gammaproteobacteria bacterium]|nr:hypothetical protein [Gammaproteobacteria bacterium]